MSDSIITIATKGGEREVRSEILDADELLAVHRTLHGNRDDGAPEWTLSHLPTGRAVIRVAGRNDAVSIGRTLLSLLTDAARAAWRSSTPRTVERRTPKRISAWLTRCQEAGRFVAPESVGA